MRRSPAGASASSRPSPGPSASSRPAPGPSARSRPAQGASTSSRPSQGASTSSRPAPGASARSRQASGTFTRSQPVKGASASSRPGQEVPARSRSPLRASTRRRPVPGDSARSQPARSRSPLGASSRYQPASGASTRSRPVPGGSASSQPAQGASSRNSIRNEAGSRAQPSNRSPSPQGATSRSPSPQGATSRSPSPQGATSRSPSPQRARSRSCPKISKKSDKLISPVNINESSENLVDVQPKTLSSHALPDKLYGVKVSNFPNALKNITLKSFLTERFMLYGNVFCVTLHRSSRDSYALVFYKEKHEQERALTADTNGPLGFKFSVTLWSGPPPDIFGIMVTNIDNVSDLSDRIRSEFGQFGDITVKIRGSKRYRVALVFYKNREDQEKALASPNPRKTSFGEVTVTARNKPPTTLSQMPSPNISSPQGGSSRSQACPKTCDKNNSKISPTVPMNKSNGDVVSPTGVDVQPTTLSSPELPDRLYGVRVSNLEKHLTNKDLTSFLTESFMLYGNVFWVTLHRSNMDSYALVFYKEKHEQEKALTADTNGPLGTKLSVTLWSGLAPFIFGIVVAHIDNGSNLVDRIRSEFGKFGDITVNLCGSKRQRVALVYYKNRKDQEKALAPPNPRKTSFGEVTVTAWNKPPTTWREMPSYEISSPQGATSSSQACPKTCDKSNSQISPPVPMNKSNGDVVRPSGRPTGVDVQQTTLSSPELPDSLYGVQVSNLEKHFENLYLKSFLAKSFMLYGNVVCVTMHGSDKNRYGLVFYKQKLEREKALTAYVKGPLGKKLCIRSWSGAPPCIFGIVVTNIDNNAVDLPDRIKSELGIFGAITLVQIRGPTHQRFALVFYKYQEGQKSALASCNPLKTSFGEVRFSPWNKPPPTCKKMSNEDISRMNTGSLVVSNLRKEGSQQTPASVRNCSLVVSNLRKEGSQQPPASVRNWPPVAVQAPMWNGPLVAVPPPVWDGQFVAVQATMWNGPPVALPAPVQATMWNGPPVALPPPVWDGQFVAIQPSRMSPCIQKDNENSKLLYSPLLESGSPHTLRGHNRSRSPLFTSARTRRSRSRSPYSFMSKNTSPTRSRYSRCQSPHSNLAISTSPLTRARYSRSQSPCSYQLRSERWPTSEIRPLREHRRAGQAEVSSTLQKSSLIIWINNLDETISRAELRSAFNPFGEIEHIEIKEGFRNNGKQAFLQYSSPSSVIRAIDHMDGTYFYNCKLQVDFAYPQQATNCLWVYGLQFADATEQYLTYVFKEFGHVQKILHDPVKGAALVLYSDAASALNAINMKTIGGHSVRLGFANRRCQLGFCHSMESSGQDVGAFFRMLR